MTAMAASTGGAAVLDVHVDVAHKAADAAAAITRKYFRQPVDVECKADASPVTQADRQAEAAMRELITAAFPDHSVFGEEAGWTQGSGEGGRYTWVLDPIDGTKSFITGKPLFGTLVSLLYDGVPVLGIIDQPILRERWLGHAGAPSTLNGEKIQTRACASINSAYLYATTPHMFTGANADAFARVRERVRMPLYGCDCYAYGLLAAGLCDLVVEADLKVYDYMALVPIIQGAGGVVTDWSGSELTWRGGLEGASTAAGEVVAAGDARTHRQALALLSGQS